MRLTSDERKAIFAGSEVALKREDKPDCKAGEMLVLGWSGGGKQFLDRKHEDREANKGRMIDIPRKPTLWIKLSEPSERVRDGVTEWVVEFERFDHREPTRLLARSGRGSDVYTSETERGYGGDSKTAIDHLEAVDDETLAEFVAEVTPQNDIRNAEQRMRVKALQEEHRASDARKKESKGTLRYIERVERHREGMTDGD